MQKIKLLILALLLGLPMSLSADNWADRVQISGLLEVEMTIGENVGIDSSDLTLGTIELGFDAQISDRVSGHVLLLHEEDDTPVEVDEGTITINLTETGDIYFTAGQLYLPFGNFESYMISDPLTLELGEARQSVLQLGFVAKGIYASAYTYNGSVVKAGSNDTVENFGVNVGYTMEASSFNLGTGISYISNIADSSGFMDNLPQTDGVIDPIDAYVSGIGVHALVGIGLFTGIFEYVASSAFKVTELAYKGDGASPAAMNFELGFAIDGRSTIALGYQMTEEAAAMGLLEEKVLVAYSRKVFDATTLGVEYVKGDYYGADEGGDGKDMSAFTVQLTAEF